MFLMLVLMFSFLTFANENFESQQLSLKILWCKLLQYSYLCYVCLFMFIHVCLFMFVYVHSCLFVCSCLFMFVFFYQHEQKLQLKDPMIPIFFHLDHHLSLLFLFLGVVLLFLNKNCYFFKKIR